MDKLISSISIKSRIYLGFIIITLFLLIISFIAYRAIVTTGVGFSNVALMNEKSQYVLLIDNSISELQRSIENYTYTGYDAVADKVNQDMDLLKIKLTNSAYDFSDDKNITENLTRMKKHLDDYQNVFVLVVGERNKRNALIKEIGLLNEELIAANVLPKLVELELINQKNTLLEYLNDPDILKINKAIAILDKRIEKIDSIDEHSSLLKKKLIEFKANYIEVVQSTRGFLFFISVVMPAETQEFKYLSNQLREYIIARTETVKLEFRKEIKATQYRLVTVAILLIVLALILSYMLSRSINKPLYKLTRTFKELSEDHTVSSIPGLHLKDEIGEMSKYAEVFRKKNEKTKQLVAELDDNKIELESSHSKLELRTSILKGILDNMADGIISINSRGIILSVNPSAIRMFGYSEKEMLGENVKMLMPQPYQNEHDDYLDCYHKTGVKKIIGIGREVPGKRKDGSLFPMELSVTETIVEGVSTFTGISRDITDRKRAEAQIEEALSFNELITNHIPDLIFVKDSEFKIVEANHAFLNMYPEFMREQVIGSTTLEKYKPEEVKQFLEQDRIAFKEGYSEVEESIQFPDGEQCLLFTQKIRFSDNNGDQYILGISRDITEQKLAEERLKNKTEELQRSNEELERFAYVASHDLQEPLRMVASYTGLLASRYKDKLDDDANDFINYAIDGAKRMQTLINDLLAFSRLNAIVGEFTLVDTDTMVEDLLNTLSHSYNQEENVSITKETLPKVKGLEPLLRQLFQNLITNAAKYSESDKKNDIHISAKKIGDHWKFSISDTGIGIAEEFHEKIFVIFKRLHGRGEYSGTGIGLALCKKIVSFHEGKIWVDSSSGKGATFHFTLPEN